MILIFSTLSFIFSLLLPTPPLVGRTAPDKDGTSDCFQALYPEGSLEDSFGVPGGKAELPAASRRRAAIRACCCSLIDNVSRTYFTIQFPRSKTEEREGKMNHRFELFTIDRFKIKTHHHRARYCPINVIPLPPSCLSTRRKAHWWVRSQVRR